MKPVLILQNQSSDGPAYLATWLNKYKIPFVAFNAEIHKEFPQNIEAYSALAVLGGAMSSNDQLLTNRQAEILILQAMHRDKPVIGHCLGGQLMSRALGGSVIQSPKPEVGWQKIDYINNSLTTDWFGISPSEKVMHWHYEMFTVPQGATLLATSEACPNQAFAIGKHLAMQFHIEVDASKVTSWVDDPDENWVVSKKIYSTAHKKDRILAEIETNITKHQEMADVVYTNWLKTTEWSKFTTLKINN